MTSGPSPSEPTRHIERWDLIRKRLLWVYRTEFIEPVRHLRRPGWQSAVLVLRGSLEVRIGTDVSHAKAGEWLITRQCDFRFQSVRENSQFLSVGWVAEWPNHEPLFHHGLPLVLERNAARPVEEASENLMRAVHGVRKNVAWDTATQHTHRDFDQVLAEEEAFAGWLRQLARTLARHGVGTSRSPDLDPRVRELLAFLQKQPLPDPLSPAEVASQVGLGWRRLTALFSAQIGLSPHRYFERRRLNEAATRLLSGDETPKEIAYQLGFRQLSHFSAWFRKHHGAAPRRFVQESSLPSEPSSLRNQPGKA